MKDKVWISPPHFSGTEIRYLKDTLQQNWISGFGKNIDVFEQALDRYLEKKHSIVLNSGTSATHLALVLLGVQAGDEVICQSMTFSASANPIVYQGANPIFIDSENDTWNMCPVALEEAIKDRMTKGKKPKAIIIVDLYGMPAKMDEISTIAKKYEIPLIEDAAEALGSTYKGQKCGTFGDFGILSFNGNKIITTSGGGALICTTQEEKQKAIFLATQAKDKAPHYQHSHIGYNYRMSNVVAGIGCGQMEVLEKRVEQRRANHQFYQSLFKGVDGIKLFTEPTQDYFSNHWLSAILIDEQKVGFSREDLRLKLLEDNIESRPLWKPMHLQPVFKDCPYYGAKVAETLFEKGLCLPSGSNLTDKDRERIKILILEVLG